MSREVDVSSTWEATVTIGLWDSTPKIQHAWRFASSILVCALGQPGRANIICKQRGKRAASGVTAVVRHKSLRASALSARVSKHQLRIGKCLMLGTAQYPGSRRA